jgi:hypothetical protein
MLAGVRWRPVVAASTLLVVVSCTSDPDTACGASRPPAPADATHFVVRRPSAGLEIREQYGAPQSWRHSEPPVRQLPVRGTFLYLADAERVRAGGGDSAAGNYFVSVFAVTPSERSRWRELFIESPESLPDTEFLEIPPPSQILEGPRTVCVEGASATIGSASGRQRMLLVDGDPGFAMTTYENDTEELLPDDELMSLAEDAEPVTRDEHARLAPPP